MQNLIDTILSKDLDEVKWALQDIFIYSWLTPLRSFIERTERRIFWSKTMKNSYDFDAHTIYDMLYHKLDRIHNCCLKHGNLVWDNSPNTNLMRKLAEAKMLAKQLADDNFDMRAWYEVTEKYEFKSWFEKITEGKHKGMHSWHSKFIKNDKRARFELKAKNKMWNKEKELTKKRFHYLLSKYIHHWWD